MRILVPALAAVLLLLCAANLVVAIDLGHRVGALESRHVAPEAWIPSTFDPELVDDVPWAWPGRDAWIHRPR